MNIIVISILLCMLILYGNCWIYSTYKNYEREKNKKSKHNKVLSNNNNGTESEGEKESLQNLNKKPEMKFWKKIIWIVALKYFNIMESVTRLTLYITSLIPSHGIRKWILKFIFKMKIEKNAVIYKWKEIRYPWNISIGKGSIIGDEAILDGRAGICIEDNVNLSTGVWIWTVQHDVNLCDFGIEKGTVKIHNRAWVSCRVVVLPGVEINEGAVIAASAVVTKNCEKFSIYGGIPAKKIGDRNKKLNYIFNGEHLHFL